MALRIARWARPALFASGALWAACASTGNDASPGAGSSGGGAAGGAGGVSGECPSCVTDKDCASGSVCAQIPDSTCAPDCSSAGACAAGRTCQLATSAEGSQVSVCVPSDGACGGGQAGAGGGQAGAGGGGNPGACGVLVGPGVTGACTSCSPGSTCQANGCYGGWWCNTQTNKCQAPPSPSQCPGGAGGAGGGGAAGAGGGGWTGGGTVGQDGGTVAGMNFAIVGDTRPALDDDTAGYPSAVITQIWQKVQARSPRPDFAVMTGDYMFASPSGGQAGPQLDLYLAARGAFSNIAFPAMGNHECTGATASNCGPSGADGVTDNETQFLGKMLAPIGKSLPYYSVDLSATDGTWTAKFVFIAANAWDAAQQAWLSGVMAKSTTYTFVVRHERTTVTNAPGVSPSEAILSQYPITIRIVGHTHTYQHVASAKEIVVGNGGAPLASAVNYGYVVARQRTDGAIQFSSYDYSTDAVVDQFAVKPDGSPAP